ncbi:MAG: hypothetical protein AAFX80_03025, partial [Cyanobacteria bacterium J06639_18]
MRVYSIAIYSLVILLATLDASYKAVANPTSERLSQQLTLHPIQTKNKQTNNRKIAQTLPDPNAPNEAPQIPPEEETSPLTEEEIKNEIG